MEGFSNNTNNNSREAHQSSEKSEYEEFRLKIVEQAKIIDDAEGLIRKMEADAFTGGKFNVVNSIIEKEKEKIKEARVKIETLKKENRQRLLSQDLKKAA